MLELTARQRKTTEKVKQRQISQESGNDQEKHVGCFIMNKVNS